MKWNLLGRIVELVRRSPTDEQSGGIPGDSRAVSQLFHCKQCDVTYIGQDMETCSSCGNCVAEIPNKKELDRFHHH